MKRVKGLVVAVDGPSGAGKSTLTKLLADRLGYVHIDTGAMFRGVAYAIRRAGVDPADHEAVRRVCDEVDIDFRRTSGCCDVFVNGTDVTRDIRTPDISMLTSRISAIPEVRQTLLRLQRHMGADGGVILEGRDIGTVVFPDAEVKFFLSASAEERGRRRFLELQAKGESITLEATVAAVNQRDLQDSQREHAPLRRAEDALDIDSTGMSIDEVLALMERLVREKQRQAEERRAVP